MSNIKVMIAGRDIKVADGYEKPSAGDVNTCAVSLAIESGGVWDSLPNKRVTFATRTASVTVDYAPTIAIPYEVMASPGALYLTLTGYDSDGVEVARTHRMTYPIEVAKAGADEGAEPSPATLDVVSRIDNLASTLEASETTRQEAFESAQNERSSDFQASMSEWQQDVAESVSQASIATERANSATSDANNAATNANEASANANSAASEANNAANDLRKAAERGDFDGEPGAPGAPGEPGADGYSPTASVTKNGGTATITVTDKNGTTTATVSDGAPGKDGSDATATDVRINGTSITANGVADIPLAKYNTPGVLGVGTGLLLAIPGTASIRDPETSDVNGRNRKQAVTCYKLDYAVKAAMCDGKGAVWTAAEQAAARERIGLGGDFELIEDITLAEDALIVRTATPSGKQYAFSKILVDFIVPSQSVKQTYYARFDNTDGQPNIWTGGETGRELHFSQWAYCENGKMFQFAHGTTTQNGRDCVNVLSSTRIPEVGKIEYLRMWAYKKGSNLFPAGTNIKIYGVWA